MINVRVTQSQCSTPSYIRMHSGPSATPMNCDWCCLKTKNKAFCAPSIIPITTHNLIDITITAVTDMRYAWNSRSDNRQQKLAIWTMFERVQMDIILMFRQRIHRRPTNTNNKWKKKILWWQFMKQSIFCVSCVEWIVALWHRWIRNHNYQPGMMYVCGEYTDTQIMIISKWNIENRLKAVRMAVAQ